MPRSKRAESVRINLEVAPAVRDRLERLRGDTGAESLTEVIRRALAVYETLTMISNGRATIVVRDAKGGEVPLILVP